MRKPAWQQKIARERIQILFDLAKKEFRKHPERSERYIQLARKIGLRYNIRLPKKLKKTFCKNCNSLLIPGLSCSVRIKRKHIIFICEKCKKYIVI